LVLEKNPPKQGLKLSCNQHFFIKNFVLEKNPPKQGLKQKCVRGMPPVLSSFREKSTKTRIETSVVQKKKDYTARVLEKNPPKQGLKQTGTDWEPMYVGSFREKSTKTRIETWFVAKSLLNVSRF